MNPPQQSCVYFLFMGLGFRNKQKLGIKVCQLQWNTSLIVNHSVPGILEIGAGLKFNPKHTEL